MLAILENDLRETSLELPFSPAADTGREESLLRRQLAKERARLARLREAYLRGAEPLESYETGQREAERIRRGIEASLARLGGSGQTPPGKTELLSLLRGNAWTPEQKNLLLSALIEKIIFDREENRIRLYYR